MLAGRVIGYIALFFTFTWLVARPSAAQQLFEKLKQST